ncbi:MAG: exo-alpha-sialidase [SAR202 cluster bacterium]|nr:exo-alpha-sialidase [SAR202 cluster bacterium]
MLKIIDQGVISKVPGRGAYMPTITLLPDGTYVAAQHVGAGLGTPDNHIELLRSKDLKTWTNEGSVHDADDELDKWCYRGPRVIVAPDGRWALVSTRFEKGDTFNVQTEAVPTCELVLMWSGDQGRKWSKPQIVPVGYPSDQYTWNGTGYLLQISPKRWMFPFETWKPEGYTGLPNQVAGAVFSSDQGKTWGERTEFHRDRQVKKLWWDGAYAIMPNGDLISLFWVHLYGTSEDTFNHWSISKDQGRTWSTPRPTNLRGQVCAPIPLKDGRVAAVYNYRHEPQGVHVALTKNFDHFDTDNEVKVFDASKEATLGKPEAGTFIAEHMKIAFGKPSGMTLPNGDILTHFWCTTQGVTHTRWVRLKAE